MKPGIFAALLFAALICATAAHAEDRDDTKGSGLPLPRFASMRSHVMNMRTGPGTRYPIEWTFTQQGLPVEIIAEYGGVWRRVRDPEGSIGWVHKSELTGKRMAIVAGGARNLLEDGDDKAAPVAHLESGTVGQLSACNKDWCKVKFDGIKGWLRKGWFWGAYPAEKFD